jgi:hypothetical protein
MAASSAYVSTYQWGCDFVMRIALGKKNVVSFAQLSYDLGNVGLIFVRLSATHTTGVEKHRQFCRKHRKNGSEVWNFSRWDRR